MESRKFNHYKPYEIRLEDSDPVSAYDNPAGAIAAFSRSKYKLWINTSNMTFFVRKNKRINSWTGPFQIGAGSIYDLLNGTVETNLGINGIQRAIRPLDELTQKTTSPDPVSDRVLIYENSTSTHKWINKNTLVQNEVLYNSGPLSGPVPAGKELGINTLTGDFYYRNASGNWQLQPVGTTVTLIDNADGTLTINAGLGGVQKSIRPIDELVTTAPILATALIPFYNGVNHLRMTVAGLFALTTNTLLKPAVNTIQSTVNGIASAIQTIIASVVHTYTPATGALVTSVNGVNSNTINLPVAATAIPLADGVADTRVGQVGTSTNYARQDHIHPITKIAPFATAPTITFSGFTSPTTTPVPMTYIRSTEETITYRLILTGVVIPNVAGRRLFTPSSVSGYLSKTETKGVYRNTAYAGYPGVNTMEKPAYDNYAGGATTYMYSGTGLPGAVISISSMTIEVTYTLN